MKNTPTHEPIIIRGWMLAIPLLAIVLTMEAVLFDKRIQEVSASSSYALPVLNNVKPFEFIDSTHQSVTLETLKGHIWIVNLVHTQSHIQTPLLLQTMSDLKRTLPESWPVRFLSVTIDPASDTPEKLAQLSRAVHARPDEWRFVTGDDAQIREFVYRSLRLGFDRERDAAEDPIGHSARLVLIDAEGNVRAYYDGASENPYPEILADLQALMV